jgi:cytochrome c2
MSSPWTDGSPTPAFSFPVQKMFFRLDDAQARADVIAYLKELH